MKYAKWIFVVLLISSLTSFVEKDKPTGGLNVGDMAPDFKIQTMSAEQSQTELSDLKGKYVLLSFWASYDAQSRMQNASLSNALRSTARNNVKMVSVSFDECHEACFGGFYGSDEGSEGSGVLYGIETC